MDRRNFFKIVSATGAGAAATACGPSPEKLIPLLVPEGQIVPGEERWHPAVCRECAAGCGTLVRVMEGRRVIETADGLARERLAAIKKIEGNPLDPVGGGKLCARGQAALQALYHPDRLRQPLRRSGDRGTAQFDRLGWDEAIRQVAEMLAQADPGGVVFLTSATQDLRSVAAERFMAALRGPAPVVCALDHHAVERAAAARAFGWRNLPVYDLARATYVLSVGADFLGSWIAPVYYARQYGEFRQGRSTIRGGLTHAESRLSLTAAAADRWLPIRPGAEPQLLAAIGALVARQRQPAPRVFTDADPEPLAEQCGVPLRRIEETAQALLDAPKPLVIGGASITHPNSVDAVVLAHQLNALLGGADLVWESQNAHPPAPLRDALAAIQTAKVLLVDDAVNPAYILPGGRAALRGPDTIVSFSCFLDDTAAYADWILPGHHYLESESAVWPSVSPGASVALAAPFVRPLYETRAFEQTLADLAEQLGLDYARVTARDVAEPLATADVPYPEIARQGGLWKDAAPAPPALPKADAPAAPAPRFDGEPPLYPLHFQAYLSTQFHDGRAAHLPWMQQLPDPASSAMWGLPVEIDPRTAAELGIATGDRVRVESPHGAFEAPAYVHPGAIPGVLSMAIGAGHLFYTRYASNRGANPIAILNPAADTATGAVLTGNTRVRLSRVAAGRLTQYSAQDRERHGEGRR